MTNPSVPFLAQSFKPGDKLAGCYTLKEPLQPQGFCFVWLAHDEELNKDIVLHFVPDPVAADSRAMSELKQEAKRNRQLIHPRIVRVHDLVEDEKWAAISMDNVSGETLASLQKKRGKNAYNPSDIAAGISELCQTLEDAHRIDLFHRDLTPENIVATNNGVMVQKFGISRVILDSLARGGHQIEASRDIAYISPQQLDAERASRADDIYSLGATVFDLLTGAPPFNDGDVISHIRKSVPPLVSERRAALGITAEPVPKAWDDAVAACLAKNVEERPKTAAETGARFASGKPGSAAASNPPVVPVAAAPEPPSSEKKEEPTPATEPESGAKQQKRPWTPGPGKAPLIAEATVLSKTDVPKGDAKAESKSESTDKVPAEPAAPPVSTSASGGSRKGGGPTTPTGFPLRAFVEVEGDAKRQKKGPSAALVTVAVVFLLIVVIAYLVVRNNPNNGTDNSVASSGTTSEASTPSPENATSPVPVEAASPAASQSSAAPVNIAAASPAPSAEASPAAPSAATESPVPAASAPPPIPASALAAMTDAQIAQLVADKTKALDQAKAALADAEKSAQDKAAAQTQASAAVQDIQAAIKQKSGGVADAKKAADAAAAALAQQQESLKKAQADADAAQKEAAAKAQAADQIRKAVDAAQAAVQQQQTAQQQAQAAADQLAKTAADRQQAADAAAKAAADAEKARQLQAQALSQAQTDLSQLQANVTQARNAEKARQAAEEAARSQKAAEEAARIQKQREAAAAQASAQVAAAAKAAADAEAALEAAKKAVADAEKAQADAERQAEAARNGAAVVPGAVPAASAVPAGSAIPTASPSPAPTQASPTLSVQVPNPHLKVDQSMINSIGMRFARVGNVLFSVWLTRVQDFTAFAQATGFKSTAWQDPGFKQAPDHPVVNVSWNDANQFCLWLTEKEHREGILTANETYRLPTDLEWSAAVGLPTETGHTPESRDMDVPDVYPWGTDWPPPPGAGNYTGEETDSDVAIKGYNDGFAWTSPVGSFNANKYGLYDMGGNVWEWCEDWWNSEQKSKVLRGGSWYNGALKLSLLSSCRIHASADQGTDNYGFRIVIAREMSKPKHHAQ